MGHYSQWKVSQVGGRQDVCCRKAEKVEKKRLEDKEREDNAAAFMKSAQSVPEDDLLEDTNFVAPIYSKSDKKETAEQ